MPLTPNFDATQTLGVNDTIDLEDTSTGSDAAIDSRRVYFITAQGGYLVEAGTTTDYEVWPYADDEISLAVLINKDYGLLVRVQWLDEDDEVLYTKNLYFGFTQYNEEFDYGLTQKIAVNPSLINDCLPKKSAIRTYIDAGNQAIEMASDISNAQVCYDKATEIRLNQSYIF